MGSSLRRKFGIGLVVVLAAIGLSVGMFDESTKVRQLPTQSAPVVKDSVDENLLDPTTDLPAPQSSWANFAGDSVEKPYHAHRVKASKPDAVAKRDMTAEVVEGPPPDTLVYWGAVMGDGSRMLIVDRPMFWVSGNTHPLLAFDTDGPVWKPMLGSQIAEYGMRFMEAHPGVLDTVNIHIRVFRTVRYVRDGQVVGVPEPDTLEVDDLDGILAEFHASPARWDSP